jgi:hypothetical protein
LAGTGVTTSDIYRYATINGVLLALPTAGRSNYNALANNSSDHPGTAIGNASDPSLGSNALNSSYDDILAIWDAYNGTGTESHTPVMEPPGWMEGFYWLASAHPSIAERHGYFSQFGGDIGFWPFGHPDIPDNYDRSDFGFVALEVLSTAGALPVVDGTAPVLDIQGDIQYAASATASSTYGQSPGTVWSIWQILGAPDSTFEGDGKAWAAQDANNPDGEWVEVGFSTPVYADCVVIKEIYQHGFVTRLDLVDESGNYYKVWEGIDTTPSSGQSSVDFKISFPRTNYLVSKAKVYVNSLHGESWEQIESIGLVTQAWAPATSTIAGSAGNSVGETITLTLTFDGNVNGLNSGDNSTIFTVAGSGVLATWSGSGSTRTLTYTIAPGQNGQAAIDEAALKTALIAGITDAAGNAFAFSGNIPNIDASALPVVEPEPLAGQDVIDLGSYGQLIAPVQVEGKWYYHWDRSADGIANDADMTSHDVLDGLFNHDIAGVSNTTDANADSAFGTTDTYRYATLNGVHLALPTLNGEAGVSAETAAGTGYTLPWCGTEYTDAGSATNGTTGPYADFTAIWDAYNGTSTGSGISGVPPGWLSTNGPWTATPGGSGHLVGALHSGGVWGGTADTYSSYYVALQVL